jgi:hypothetical protein
MAKLSMPDPKVEFDPSPEYACAVLKDEVTGIGYVSSWMAFVPEYGPESEAQIEYWRKKGYPGADTWEVGKRIKVVSPKAALSHMQAHQQKENP